MIDQLDADSPAALAGTLAGEALLAANGVPLTSRLDALRVTAPLAIGERLELRLRAADGSERTATCWLAPAPGP